MNSRIALYLLNFELRKPSRSRTCLYINGLLLHPGHDDSRSSPGIYDWDRTSGEQLCSLQFDNTVAIVREAGIM